jgi:DNA polymerase III alpha subunit
MLPLRRARSHHSSGRGTASVRELVAAGVNAVTDVDTLAGQVELHHACAEAGTKPITGVELRDDAVRIVLIARDDAGWSSLCRAVTARRAGRDPVGSASEFGDGVVALADDPAVLARLVAAGLDARALVVRPRPGFAEADVRDAARKLGIPLVADVDATMRAGDRDLHALLVAIAGGVADPPERVVEQPPDLFDDAPDALRGARALVDACALDLRGRPVVLPAFEGDPDRMLRARVGDGLEDELAVIRSRGIAAYFLLVDEVIGFCRANGIRWAIRGSAASSRVLFALGASDVDPVRHGLLFERFLHPSRDDLPDVDLDLDAERRHEVIAFVRRRFGADRVAMVSSAVAWQWRTAVRDGFRALGMPKAELARVLAALPAEDLDAAAVRRRLPLRWQPAVELVGRLFGVPRHRAVHPGGVVVADRPLDGLVPLERLGGVVATQVDKRSIGDLGLVKLDLLGNRFLSQLGRALGLAGVPAIPPEDAATLDTLRRGDTIGCFQVETPAMRSLLARLPLKSTDDLLAALAVIRPGPASGAAKDAFVRRARGEEPSVPVDPAVADLLAGTHGLLLYDEDIVRVLARVGAMSLGDAERVRSAVVDGAPVPEPIRAAHPVLADAITRFAAYSFNKAHAVSYARLAFEAAWLKTHLPAEFGCALLDDYGGHYPLRTLGWDLLRHGVRLSAPSVQASEAACTLEDGAIRLGLGRIRHLSARVAGDLLVGRPFADVDDLVTRVRPSGRELEALVLSGACDGLPPLSAQEYPIPHLEVLARHGRAVAVGTRGPPPPGPARVAWQRLARVHLELTWLELSCEHPLALLREEADRAGCTPIAGIRGDRARIAGVLASSARVETRGGAAMQFLTFEDETGLIEAALFPGVRARIAALLVASGPWLAEGRVRRDQGDALLEVTELRPFHERA